MTCYTFFMKPIKPNFLDRSKYYTMYVVFGMHEMQISSTPALYFLPNQIPSQQAFESFDPTILAMLKLRHPTITTRSFKQKSYLTQLGILLSFTSRMVCLAIPKVLAHSPVILYFLDKILSFLQRYLDPNFAKAFHSSLGVFFRVCFCLSKCLKA